MRFIHAADIHLDSPLAGMAQRHPVLALLVATCTRDAFTNLVDHATGQEADFLLIAGDLYDAEHKNYETGLFFAREMQRLARPCILIHGNHDSASQITKSLHHPPNVTIRRGRRRVGVRRRRRRGRHELDHYRKLRTGQPPLLAGP